MNHRRKYVFLVLCLLLVSVNVMAQLLMQASGLDNRPVNGYSLTSFDALDYVEKAELVALHGDFVNAFRDGYRLPGYPLFLSAFYHLSDRPLLAARYVQVFLSALVILFSYLALVNLLQSYVKAILGASVIALWIPLYYFSPILYAESCSLFLFALTIYVLSELMRKTTTIALYSLPILLALLVYLKPNHLFLVVPVVAALGYKRYQGGDLTWRRSAATGGVFILLLLPWTLFVSDVNDKVIPLSTTQGINLYLGTGVAADPEDQSSVGSLHRITADRLGLVDEQVMAQTQREVQGRTRIEKNAHFTKVAREVWMSRPVETTLYGVSKILHGFGFSLRSLRDVVLVLFFVSSIASSVYLWTSNSHREWCVFFWGVVFVASCQMFLFLPNQRLKTVLFDLPALVMIVAGASQLLVRAGPRIRLPRLPRGGTLPPSSGPRGAHDVRRT